MARGRGLGKLRAREGMSPLGQHSTWVYAFLAPSPEELWEGQNEAGAWKGVMMRAGRGTRFHPPAGYDQPLHRQGILSAGTVMAPVTLTNPCAHYQPKSESAGGAGTSPAHRNRDRSGRKGGCLFLIPL